MTIQKIAQKQLDTFSNLHFARKGTSDCYWFSAGTLRTYSDTQKDGRSASLSIDDLAATDWRIITPSK
jgi:hypothetical protein